MRRSGQKVSTREKPRMRENKKALPGNGNQRFQLEHDGELVLAEGNENPVVEKFLRLKTKLSHGQLSAFKTLLVTSPVPGEGKSTVSMNLALAFANNLESPTILVDCDLRRPSVRRWMRPAPTVGLLSVLRGDVPFERALCKMEGSNLHILPAVKGVPDPMETLTSSRFKHLLSMIKESYTRVIIDTPPIVPFPDADALGTLADGVIMVVRAGKTPKHLYVRGLESVHSAPLLGTVLNGTSPNLVDKGHHDGSYYYDYYQKKR